MVRVLPRGGGGGGGAGHPQQRKEYCVLCYLVETSAVYPQTMDTILYIYMVVRDFVGICKTRDVVLLPASATRVENLEVGPTSILFEKYVSVSFSDSASPLQLALWGRLS